MNRFIILPIIVGVLLSVTFFLPGQGNLQNSAISLDLPTKLNNWKGYSMQPSLKEKNTLSKDTVFRKMEYWRLGHPQDHYTVIPGNSKVNLSVVFSGHDVNNSIHRPERCLPAQGHYNMTSRDAVVPIPLLEAAIPVKRLSSKQKITLSAGPDGAEELVQELDSLTYYFFVGHKALSNSHTERTILDVKDRLLLGYDQRWAFVSMSLPFGPHPYPNMQVLMEEEADKILSQMTADLATRAIDWDMISRGVLPLMPID